MISALMAWWRGQLLSLIPKQLWIVNPWSRRALIVAVENIGDTGQYSVYTRRHGIDACVGQSVSNTALRRATAANRLPVLLRLPHGALLEQIVPLPIAAERDAERVLRYEMDRLTPFAADALFWSWVPARRNAAAGRFEVRLSLVSRARVQPILTALHAAGVHPAALEAPAPSGEWRYLMVAHRRPGWAARRGPALAGALCGTLALAVLVLPFAMQDRARTRVEARITALKPRVTEAEALRRAILERAATTDVMQAARVKAGDALAVLIALTAALPDDTHLTDLTLRTRDLVITGESATATRLIETLAAEPGFLNPSFAAPVTRTPGGGAVAFSIRAAVAP